MTERIWRVGYDGDFPRAGPELLHASELARLSGAGRIEIEQLSGEPRVAPRAYVTDFDALIIRTTRLPAEILEPGEPRLRVVARFGVGYDNIAIEACAKAGVLVGLTPEGVRRPVAAGVMAFVLALAHRLPVKDRLTREGRWKEGRAEIGMGLTGRTLGVVGLGNLGREICRLAEPFGMRRLAVTRSGRSEAAAALGVELVDLGTLLADADVVVLACPLTEETRGLIDAAALARMKPTAYLVNVARGPVVDEGALVAALREGAIAGAGLDVFAEEPAKADNPLFALDNVIVAPHAVGWTDEWSFLSSKGVVDAVLAVMEGRVPDHLVNPEALGHPRNRGLRAAPA